ncbi:hypothetical protein, partial [Klebsiella michiganensis]|uniref:hypothetical protein n=1 Tax=Klebsiella michiganensis TaxID=1134687 RepID=UPI001C610BC2
SAVARVRHKPRPGECAHRLRAGSPDRCAASPPGSRAHRSPAPPGSRAHRSPAPPGSRAHRSPALPGQPQLLEVAVQL